MLSDRAQDILHSLIQGIVDDHDRLQFHGGACFLGCLGQTLVDHLIAVAPGA